MSNGGYILLYRKLQDHWLWQDDKMLKWWLIILFNVNHSPARFPIDGEIHICNPGQSFRSIDSWTSLFGCSKKTTIKFFQMLENDEMITREIVGKGNRRKHLLTVVNWTDYQQTETENYTERVLKTTPKMPSNNKGRIKENEGEITSIGFDEFWNSFHSITGKPKTDKEPAFKYWKKLTTSEKEKALNNIRQYFHSLKDPQYCKKARTYLADKNFEDEFKQDKQENPFGKRNGNIVTIKNTMVY